MRNNIIIIILSTLITIIIGFMIIFNVYINNIDNISKSINNDTMKVKKDNDSLNKKLKEIKQKNKIQNEILENINNYIDLLNEKVKTYE